MSVDSTDQAEIMTEDSVADVSKDSRLHIILRLDSNHASDHIVRKWFELAWAQLGGQLREALEQHPLPTDNIRPQLNAGRIGAVHPPVGMPWCQLVNFGGDDGREVVAAHTMNPRSWSWFLNQLLERGPHAAHVDGGFITELPSARGFMRIWPRSPNFSIAANNLDQVHIGVSADVDFLAGTLGREDAICAFLYEVAAHADPTYGEIAIRDARGGLSFSLLESSLKGLDFQAKQRNWRVHPRDQLKGYSWVTIMPGDIVDALGGIASLQASNAFHEVRSLPAGGAWLKATKHLAHYDLRAATRVFEVVQPVLIKGIPADADTPLVKQDPSRRDIGHNR